MINLRVTLAQRAVSSHMETMIMEMAYLVQSGERGYPVSKNHIFLGEET